MNTLFMHVRSRRVCLLLFVIISSLQGWAQNFVVDGVKYNITSASNQKAEVIGLENLQLRDLTIPAMVEYQGDSYAVTSIAPQAFENNEVLTSVVLPEGLSSLGKMAFENCSSLLSVSLPKSLTSIGERAFMLCDALSSIVLPEGLTSIEKGVFEDCGRLSSVTFPKSLTSIGEKAFRSCNTLSSVTFPKSLTSIGKNAFGLCFQLSSVTFPEGLTSIGEWAFANSPLSSVTFPASLTSIGERAFVNVGELIATRTAAPALPVNAFANVGKLCVPYGATGYDQGVWATVTNRQIYLDLSDQVEQFVATQEEANVKVNYTRKFDNTAWQPLFVPFDLAVNDLKGQFEVARLKDEQNAGYVDAQMLEAGETLAANSLAIIRSKQVGEQTIELPATTVRPSEEVAKIAGVYTFYGTRQKQTNGLDRAGRWVMAGGELRPALSSLQLNAFRWYLDVQPSTPTQGLTLHLTQGGRLTTIGRTPTATEGEATLYDLTGRRLKGNSGSGQLRIVNGQKTF